MDEAHTEVLKQFSPNNLEKLQTIFHCVKDWQQFKTSQLTGVVVIPKKVLEQSGLVVEGVAPLLDALNKKMNEAILTVEDSPIRHGKYTLTREMFRGGSDAIDDTVIFSFPDSERLLKTGNELDELLDGHASKTAVSGGKISQIVLVKSVNTKARLRVVVNDNYSDPMPIKSTGVLWSTLLKIAEGQKPPAKGHRNVITYFNSNTLNPLYSKGRYALTRILEERDGTIVGKGKILATPISERAYQLRKNRKPLT